MKSKSFLLLSGLVLLYSSNSFAIDNSQNSFSSDLSLSDNEKSKEIEEKKFIESVKKNLAVEENFVQGGMNYTIFKGLKASTGKEDLRDFSNDESAGKNSFDLNVSAPKTVLLDKGEFKIYFEGSDNKKLKQKVSVDRKISPKNDSGDVRINENYKVAFNNKTKKFAVITGNIILKVDPEVSKIKVPNSNYKVLKSYKNMGLYVIKYPENVQIKEATDKLKSLNPASVTVDGEKKSSINVEVLENFKKPM
ncbi:hypothetical protein QEJ31_06530 [Pigmentibacter sp. JX0631]|uniref:hypothetical protein n=1 Tax=Pigmentibacter sp. JX0631 TaxID=2976982 RepID=UPI002469718C|nr:hypothetical protein [Pigmentibacter sp. JX0631]WGL61246.1 hypothetical protein QEJ31_06530 [Pigmentibacter sp. JX0631]